MKKKVFGRRNYRMTYIIYEEVFMDKLTEQWLRVKIEESKEKLEEKQILEEKRILTEKKIPANIDLLNAEMAKVPELKKLLNMPAKEMKDNEDYKNYLYLMGEVLPEENEGNTLLDIIQGSLQFLNKNHCYFSINEKNELRGFFAYAKGTGNYVKQIKMFSFDQKGDRTFAIDLENFVKELCESYDFVSWSAVKANKANKGYEIALKKLEKAGYVTILKPVKCVIKNELSKFDGFRYFISNKYTKQELKDIAKKIQKI